MKSALVVGGSNGIGLSIALHLEGYDRVYIIDKQEPACPVPANVRYLPFDLLDKDYTLFDRLDESISTLVITAGYGRLALFSDVEEYEIERLFMVNTIGVIRILKHFYSKLHSATDDFHCAVMVSIAGIVSSPFFSIYGIRCLQSGIAPFHRKRERRIGESRSEESRIGGVARIDQRNEFFRWRD